MIDTTDSIARYPTPAALALSLCVIPFAVGTNRLDVALTRSSTIGRERALSLPSGSLDPGETLGAAAARIANDSLSTAPDYIEQLYTFSVQHSPTPAVVAYFALLSASTRLTVESSGQALFRDVDALDDLSKSDRQVVGYAKVRLRAKLGYSNVAFHLLPPEFTLSDLQAVYQTVLGQPLDKRNFRRRVLAAEIVESVGAMRPTNHRPATLYRFVGGDPARGALTPEELDWSS